MYDLPYHKALDDQDIRDLVAAHPFALLTGCDPEGRPIATQLPLFLEARGDDYVLSGHMMRNTDHHRAFEANPQALAVFTGPNVYVSGSWYTEPHTPSTWNYMSVHARGRMRFLDGDSLEAMLQKTSLYFEGGDDTSPTVFANLPRALTDRLVHAIVAFEIDVELLDSVFKLSQDRDATSYRNIIEQLGSGGEDARRIAEEMERRLEQVFPDQDA